MEKQLRQVRDLLVVVNYTYGQFADLTFDLDHVIQDQMGQHHQSALANFGGIVTQPEGRGKAYEILWSNCHDVCKIREKLFQKDFNYGFINS